VISIRNAAKMNQSLLAAVCQEAVNVMNPFLIYAPFILSLGTFVVAIGTLLVALCMFKHYYMPTFRKQTTLERARLFFEWSKWFESDECANWKSDKNDPNAPTLLDLLVNSQPDSDVSEDRRNTAKASLALVPIARKEAVLGFFEQLAIAVNTELLKPEAANYMFGYYAVLIKETKEFWTGGLANEGDEWYWKVFNRFVDDMRSVQAKAKDTAFDPRRVTL